MDLPISLSWVVLATCAYLFVHVYLYHSTACSYGLILPKCCKVFRIEAYDVRKIIRRREQKQK